MYKKSREFFFYFFRFDVNWKLVYVPQSNVGNDDERENFIVRSNVEKKVWRKEWKRFFYALKDSLHAKGGNEREERSA